MMRMRFARKIFRKVRRTIQSFELDRPLFEGAEDEMTVS